MVKGYSIAHAKIHDKEEFAEFSQMATPIISECGGTVLDRNPTPEVKADKIKG